MSAQQTFQQAVKDDLELTPEQKAYWLDCDIWCDECKSYSAKYVSGISADVRGVGIDVSNYKCMKCGEEWSD